MLKIEFRNAFEFARQMGSNIGKRYYRYGKGKRYRANSIGRLCDTMILSERDTTVDTVSGTLLVAEYQKRTMSRLSKANVCNLTTGIS